MPHPRELRAMLNGEAPVQVFQIRTISAIAAEITRDWKPVYFGAVPYLNAMRSLGGIDDSYGADTARSVVSYFLANAHGWKGPVARRVKNELKAMLKS